MVVQAMSPARSLYAGQILMVLLMAALLTLPVGWVLLRAYRRRVLRSMSAAGSERWPEPDVAAPPPRAGPPPALVDVAALPTRESPLLERAMRRPWHAAGIYALAGLAAAAVLGAFDLSSSRMEHLPLRSATLAWVQAWPVVLATWMVAAVTRRARALVALAFLAVYAGLVALAMRRSPDLTWGQVVLLLVIVNVVPTAMMAAALNRRVRAVGPATVAVLAVAFTGPTAAMWLLGASTRLLAALAALSWRLHLGALLTILLYAGVALAALGAVGWLALRGIGSAYDRKLVSDQSLTIDALWLLVCIAGGTLIANDEAVWLVAGPVAFAAYLLVTRTGFALLRRRTAGADAPRLLLLRVFALGRRSEALYDAFGSRWRQVGSIQLIAGPDLATSTIEPHELVDFMRGRLARHFVSGPADLERRVASLDLHPDRDCRYRVTEFFCTDDGWRHVLARLVAGSDVVLMDLRDFTPRRAGCIWEIGELVATVPADRFLLAVDATTDVDYLAQVVRDAAARRPAGAGLGPPADAPIRIFRMDRLDGATLRALVGSLLTTPPPVAAPTLAAAPDHARARPIQRC